MEKFEKVFRNLKKVDEISNKLLLEKFKPILKKNSRKLYTSILKILQTYSINSIFLIFYKITPNFLEISLKFYFKFGYRN